MTLIAKYKVLIFAMTLILFSQNNAYACQCFNTYFLNSIFSNNQNVSCFISRDYGEIVSARITDGRNNAVSLYYGCSLNSAYSNIRRDYYDIFTNDNGLCIDAIIQACTMLNVALYPE